MGPSTLISMSSAYNFIRGPLVWISFIVFLFGTLYQVFKFLSFTRKNPHVMFNPRPRKKIDKSLLSSENISKFITRTKLSVVGVNPLMIIVTTIFHLCLIITPLLLLAHNILLKNAIGFSFFSLSEKATDYLTVVFLICGGYFLFRRVAVDRVKAITDWYDYLILFLATAPFITGFLAYHQVLATHYKLIISLHIVFGELMLMAIPFTKFVHMIFFFVFRFLIESEYSLGKGDRTW